MTPALVLDLARAALATALLLAAPLLVVALLVGLLVSVLQAATGIQEQVLAFVPKLLAVGATFLLLLPWLIDVATRFTRHLVGAAAALAR